MTKELLNRMDIEIHFIATGASRANGQAERYGYGIKSFGV